MVVVEQTSAKASTNQYFAWTAIRLWTVCCVLTAGTMALTSAVAQTVASANQELASPEIERKVEALLRQMTLDEKLGQLVQYNGDGFVAPSAAKEDSALAANPEAHYRVNSMELAAAGKLGSMLNVTGAARTAAFQHAAVDKSRLHIPLLFGADVIHGYRTVYPVPLGLAATFDPEMVTKLSRMAAQEATTAGIRWFYSPMVDISRDARWGRSTEGAGEDAYLGAAMARAYIRGYQGTSLRLPDSVAASVKHYAAYGAAEAGREYNTTDMSDSRLRQVYLPPYKAAVEAGAATMMSAFNALNGVPATANPYLLDTILRKEWGFNGFVVSDYTAVMELLHHGIALTASDATEKALKAGVEVDMMSHFYDAELPGLLRSGRVPQSVIDEAVRRVLRVKFALGLFENPYPSAPEVTAAVPEHRPLVREAAEESLVLLKNEGLGGDPALPLKPGVKLALIGPLADNANEMQGAWGGAHRSADVVTLRSALEEFAKAKGGSVVAVRGAEISGTSDAGFAEAEAAARAANVVVMALGESSAMSGEAGSRTHLDLPGNQEQLLERVVGVGKPVVLVVFSGRPLVLTWAAAHVPSILEAWFPGTEGGHAITNVLFGITAPSGKLPMSFPVTEGQEPLYYNQFPTGRPPLRADLTVPPVGGTRFISRYIDAPNAALFPFGFGLSYTTFAYSHLTVSRAEIPLRDAKPGSAPLVLATATVTNTGKRAGTEVVQCYVGNRGASLEQPLRSLQGFARVALQPGESRKVEFPLGFEELSFYDTERNAKMEATQYTVWIGGDSLATENAGFRVTP
ncbi:glycoside hydrolase family 3 N-terminal domain-containing protein [Edaphobacter bradus]|uniref:glycoside hydrolase family 3 N-terminal domain-containing protein n=1 Tax=Edaphobacter bradus TaxID=2259016 RepID=UPI0021E0909E|nr:glycoside hydrolase family 3 N-terminal domain-containing protein [Edaphobacter bradus]